MRFVPQEFPQSPSATRRSRSLPTPARSLSGGLELKSQLIPGESGAVCASPTGLSVSAQVRCRIVRQVTAEMVMLVSERVQVRRDRRRATCHIRQIAMYICHVVLQLSLTDIGTAFGRDRTTVGHACNVVEDRRDDKAYDEFVAAIERVVISVFGATGGSEDAR
jgi:hypothetical protein